MFLLSISSFMWDLIIIIIILFGFVSGFFVGMQALVFVTTGNALALGLAYAFKSLILPSFVGALLPLFSQLPHPSLEHLAADNFGNALYFLIWMIGLDIIFWLLYLIFKLTSMRKYEINHLAINSIGGSVINTVRMAIVGAYVILFAGSGLIANRTEVLDNYLVNDIADQSVMYKFYSSIYPDIPFFNIKNSDLYAINDFNNYSKIITYTIDGIENATSGDEIASCTDAFNQVQPFSNIEKAGVTGTIGNIKNDPSYLASGKDVIKNIINKHVDKDFLSIDFMQSKLDMMQNIVNLYPDTSEFFKENFQNIINQKPKVDTSSDLTAWNDEIKPAIQKFLAGITNSDTAVADSARATMEVAFNSLYNDRVN